MTARGTPQHKIQSQYFTWNLYRRGGLFYADGRSNRPPLGRFSLGTDDHSAALDHLRELDLTQAVRLGRVEKPLNGGTVIELGLPEGRRLFEAHVGRSEIVGGARLSTRKRYRAVFDKLLEFASTRGVVAWNQITRALLEAYVQHLEQKGYAYRSIYLEATVVKQAVNWLIEAGHLPESCRLRLRLSRDNETSTYCWTEAEVRAMLEHCRARPDLQPLGQLLTLLALTGLRISEALQLRWSDVDLTADQPMIHLVDESRKRQRALSGAVRTLKGKRGRSLPIYQDLRQMLLEMPRRSDGLVFHGPQGGRWKSDSVRTLLKRAVIAPLAVRFHRSSGEPGFESGRLHSFRHFFCSQCANQGIPERTLMSWLGHAEAAMVRRYYHLTDTESRRLMDRLSIQVVTPVPEQPVTATHAGNHADGKNG
jgi:integrase